MKDLDSLGRERDLDAQAAEFEGLSHLSKGSSLGWKFNRENFTTVKISELASTTPDVLVYADDESEPAKQAWAIVLITDSRGRAFSCSRCRCFRNTSPRSRES
jgi:hypothetical protein